MRIWIATIILALTQTGCSLGLSISSSHKESELPFRVRCYAGHEKIYEGKAVVFNTYRDETRVVEAGTGDIVTFSDAIGCWGKRS